MPWCPNCRNEYREGITVCADCGATLVDELPEEEVKKATVAYITEEELANRLCEYLSYNKIENECEFNEEQQAYAVLVKEDDKDEAKKLFAAFGHVEISKSARKTSEALAKVMEAQGITDAEDFELDEEALESIPEEELSQEEKDTLRQAFLADQVYKPAEVYVKKADESKEMFSTAITFFVFAVFLFVFLILNVLEVITFFSNLPSLIVLGALTAGCCAVGINAIKRSKKAESASVEEDKVTKQIGEWLETVITEDFFAELEGADLSEEVLYLRRTEMIEKRLFEEFPELDESFADTLVEEFYNSHFEN